MVDPLLFATSCLGAFGLGYVLGRLDRVVNLLKKPESNSFVADVAREQRRPAKKIQIDETKFVTDVSTDEMTAVGDQQLGTISRKSDDITSAASRLAQLKKSKG
jgi:hypothetical protein